MIPERHVMLDLETMGTGPNAAIIAIGAVEFDREGLTENEFYATVSLESCAKVGLSIEAGTVLWWMKQDEAARNEFIGKQGFPVYEALQSFSKWFPKGAKVWGNGAAFDNVILRNAYSVLGYDAPWPFWDDRCYRTVRAEAPTVQPVTRVGTYHNALDDAKTQALQLIEIWRA